MLHGSEVELQGVRFFGLGAAVPETPFGSWSYDLSEDDARNVGHVISATLILKSIERIGDHAKNIAEYVVYLVKGKDVRHVSPESIEKDLAAETE